ncbi:Tyrosine recombinase XerD [subsurface metagenome]
MLPKTQTAVSTKAPETLTDAECSLLLAAVLAHPDGDRYQELAARNLLILLLMLDAGLRGGEVVRLVVSDLAICDEPVKALRVRAEISKSHIDRTVPLTKRTCQAIYECYKDLWARPGVFHNNFAFPSRSSAGHLTTVQIERIVKAAAAKSIHRDIHPHMLRHTFATKLMRTINARIVQQLLGHKYISSTQIYMHPGAEDLRKAVDSLE